MMIPYCSKAAIFTTVALSIALVGCNDDKATSVEPAEPSTPSLVSPISSVITATPSLDSDATVVTALQSSFEASGLDKKIISAIPTDMPNIYWVTAEGVPAFFTDKEGKHIIQGQIVQLGDAEPVDISAKFITLAAKTQLAQVNKEDMIIYPATGETTAVVYAFTDADCGYCRKLHSDMSDINAEGIEVRYLAWPRSQETVPKMQNIWCSDDRITAMDTAKSGGEVVSASEDCKSPVTTQVDLGFSLGVTGTPAIFTESGSKIGGYMPAAALAEAAIAN